MEANIYHENWIRLDIVTWLWEISNKTEILKDIIANSIKQ